MNVWKVASPFGGDLANQSIPGPAIWPPCGFLSAALLRLACRIVLHVRSADCLSPWLVTLHFVGSVRGSRGLRSRGLCLDAASGHVFWKEGVNLSTRDETVQAARVRETRGWLLRMTVVRDTLRNRMAPARCCLRNETANLSNGTHCAEQIQNRTYSLHNTTTAPNTHTFQGSILYVNACTSHSRGRY